MLFLNIPIYIHAVAEHVSIFDRHTKNVLKIKRLQKLMDYKKNLIQASSRFLILHFICNEVFKICKLFYSLPLPNWTEHNL